MPLFSNIINNYDILQEVETPIDIEDVLYESFMDINMLISELVITSNQTEYLYESYEMYGQCEILQEGAVLTSDKIKNIFDGIINIIKRVYGKAVEYIHRLVKGNRSFIKKYNITINDFEGFYVKDFNVEMHELDTSFFDLPKMDVLNKVRDNVMYSLVKLQRDPASISTTDINKQYRSPGVLEEVYGEMVGASIRISKEDMINMVSRILLTEKSPNTIYDKKDVEKCLNVFDEIEKLIPAIKKQETELITHIKKFQQDRNYNTPPGLNGDGWSYFREYNYAEKRNVIISYYTDIINAYLTIFNIKLKCLNVLNREASMVIAKAYQRRIKEDDIK